jgi:hypothetical protein
VDKPNVQFREPEELLRPYTNDNLRHELIMEDFPELAKAPSAPPSPNVIPEISEEELDQMKCAQRREQDEQWDRMSKAERDEMRKRIFYYDGSEHEPLTGADPQ